MDMSRRQICDIMNGYRGKCISQDSARETGPAGGMYQETYYMALWLAYVIVRAGWADLKSTRQDSRKGCWDSQAQVKLQSTGSISPQESVSSNLKVYQLIELGAPRLFKNNLCLKSTDYRLFVISTKSFLEHLDWCSIE